jgi:hypothetical protein
MERLRQAAGGLMLVSGVTHTAHFLLADPSPTNTAIAAGFGACYFVIGVLLLRPWPVGLWLGAVIPAIGGLLGGLVALQNPEPLALLHALINWIVFPICIYLLFRTVAPSETAG